MEYAPLETQIEEVASRLGITPQTYELTEAGVLEIDLAGVEQVLMAVGAAITVAITPVQVIGGITHG